MKVRHSTSASPLRLSTHGSVLQATDKRVTLVQELLNSVRILKMFAWERPSIKRINDARSLELEKIKKRAKIYSCVPFASVASHNRKTDCFECRGMMFLSTGIPASVTLATFGVYVFVQKESLTASTAFTAMSLFSLLREAVSKLASPLRFNRESSADFYRLQSPPLASCPPSCEPMSPSAASTASYKILSSSTPSPYRSLPRLLTTLLRMRRSKIQLFESRMPSFDSLAMDQPGSLLLSTMSRYRRTRSLSLLVTLEAERVHSSSLCWANFTFEVGKSIS